jgi:TMEM175 potassium channel family protein
VSTNRLEAFSDGVIAIAITLLTLDLKVPDPATTGSLGNALGDLWPNYAAYVVTFLTVGIIWINHHAMVHRLRRVDHTFLILNLLLLLTIGILPFTTSLVAAYLGEQGEHVAAAVYAASLLAMSCAFFAAQRRALVSTPGLLEEGVTARVRREILRRARAGLLPYAAAMAVAPLSGYATLALCGLTAGYYALPRTTNVETS